MILSDDDDSRWTEVLDEGVSQHPRAQTGAHAPAKAGAELGVAQSDNGLATVTSADAADPAHDAPHGARVGYSMTLSCPGPCQAAPRLEQIRIHPAFVEIFHERLPLLHRSHMSRWDVAPSLRTPNHASMGLAQPVAAAELAKSLLWDEAVAKALTLVVPP
jgi:hypothetical protein